MASTFRATRVKAVEGKINAESDRIKIYTAEVPAETVAQFYVERALDVEGGFQRPVDSSRAKNIGRLMGGSKKNEEQPLPNIHGGLLAFADASEIDFRNSGWLTIKKPLRLIDGQHRAAGAAWAVANGYWHDYTETVKIVVGASRVELAVWYLRTNMLARKVEPSNILLNVATMAGTQMKRKSWVARETVVLATMEPFALDEKRLVSFSRRDGGRISAYTLYKAINLGVPDDINHEGAEYEEKAIKFCQTAFTIYASLFEDWGKVEEDGELTPLPAYEFTMMVAFARLYKALYAAVGTDAINLGSTISKAWRKAGLTKGLPEGYTSGERAAIALANYVAGEMSLGPIKVSIAA